MKHLIILFCFPLLADSARREYAKVDRDNYFAPKPMVWKDLSANPHNLYVLLHRLNNFNEAERDCKNRNLDLFDLNYLTPEEWKRLRTAQIFEQLPWQVRYPGEESEHEYAVIWNSAVKEEPGGTKAQVNILKRFKRHDYRLSVTQQYINTAPEKNLDVAHYASFCMAKGPKWVACSGQQQCTKKELWKGKEEGAITLATQISTFREYGETEAIAKERLLKKINTPKRMLGERIQESCELAKTTLECEVVRQDPSLED